MKFRMLPRFRNEFNSLHPDHQRRFLELIPAFNRACEEYWKDPGGYSWPKRLRVHPMTSVEGIWEMTWSFSGPDGRATFRFVIDDQGDALVEWRRVGRHGIYKNP